MHYIPFNSYKSYHKSPFGAVKAGSEITFRLILPHSFGARKVRLAIRRDGSVHYDFHPLSPESPQGDSEQWWALSYKAGQAGLYFYDFSFDTDHGRQYIYNCGAGPGQINSSPAQWQLTVYDPDFKSPDWLKGGLIYQIFPDRFYASGQAKTNIACDRILRSDWGGTPQWQPDEFGNINSYDYFGGDLKGIELKLPYLKELGVNCLYLNPIFEAHSNHRYDTADYLKIDPLLGDEADFKSLCDRAAALGIGILLDGVFSHTGADSIYFNKFKRYPQVGAYNSQDSPYYHWYKFKEWPHEYESWWGIDILPELDEENPAYIDFITGPDGVLQKWLKLGARGWRLDVADELPDGFLNALRKSVKSSKQDAFILGEVWEDASNKVSHGGRRSYLLGAQLDSVMNYPLSEALLKFVSGGKAREFLNSILSLLENYPKPAIDTLMNHLGTHDTLRILSLLGGAQDAGTDGRAYKSLSSEEKERGLKLLKLASTILYCLPGLPGIYYGDEAGLEGGHDPYNRACYPWGKENKELLDFYKALGRMRQGQACLIDGDFEVVYENEHCMAFARSRGTESLLCIANSGETQGSLGLPSKYLGARPLLGQAAFKDDKLLIPAHQALLLSLE